MRQSPVFDTSKTMHSIQYCMNHQMSLTSYKHVTNIGMVNNIFFWVCTHQGGKKILFGSRLAGISGYRKLCDSCYSIWRHTSDGFVGFHFISFLSLHAGKYLNELHKHCTGLSYNTFIMFLLIIIITTACIQVMLIAWIYSACSHSRNMNFWFALLRLWPLGWHR